MHFVNTERINKVVIHFKSSSICVSPGFGGLTEGAPAVRPAASTGTAGNLRAVGPVDLHRSDRRHLGSHTDRSSSVRPISIDFEGNFYFR